MSQLASAEFWSLVGVLAGVYTIFALGLQLQLGYTGLLNFGHAASMAIAAYTMAILVTKTGLALWLAVLVAIATAAAFGFILAMPTARLRAGPFALVTLGMAEIVRVVAANVDGLTGGWQGTINLLGPGKVASYNAEWLAFQAHLHGWLERMVGPGVPRDLAMLIIVWSVAITLLLFLQVLVRSPWGRVLRSIREDEEVASAVGKNTFPYKVQAMVLGTVFGAIAGLLFAFQASFFTPDDFAPFTFFALTILVLGGVGRIWAVPLGALAIAMLFAGTRFLALPPFSYLDAVDRGFLRLIVVGLVLILAVGLRPWGLLGRSGEEPR